MALRVKLWGIRGSLPAPHTPEEINEKIYKALALYLGRKQPDLAPKDFVQSLPPELAGGYGGHTACVEVFSPSTSVIIDGGSGIRRLGDALANGPAGTGTGVIHIFLTHFHWDHLIGLPFFLPMFVPGNEVNFYAVQPDLEEQIRWMFQKPRFPVPYESLASKVRFHQLAPRKPTQVGDISLTPYKLDHPDPSWGYRIEHGGRVFSHCVDTECSRLSREEIGEDLPLYQSVDLMLFDAQYTFAEATEKINWGHSSAPIGLDLALREGIKKVLFMHHDPSAPDVRISAAEAQTRSYYQSILKQIEDSGEVPPTLEWSFAREGMVIEV